MIKLIAACDPYGGIGYKGKIPWHVPEDMKLFKELTMGHIVVMGSKTYKSISKPLPGRHNVIITRSLGDLSFHKLRDPSNKNEGRLETTTNIDWAKNNDSQDKTIWIIGGAEIYNYYLKEKLIQECHITIVNSDEICDKRIQIYHIHDDFVEDPAYTTEFLSPKENRMCTIKRYTRKSKI